MRLKLPEFGPKYANPHEKYSDAWFAYHDAFLKRRDEFHRRFRKWIVALAAINIVVAIVALVRLGG